MLNLLRRTLKRHIDSTNPFWWYAIEAASLGEAIAGWLSLPICLAYHWREFENVLSARRAIRAGRTVLAFGLPREHFKEMYEPILERLPAEFDAWLVVPNSSKTSDVSRIHACWSIFVPWHAYVSCWFSLEHPDPIDVRSGKLNIQLYHGGGAAYIADAQPLAHSSAMYRKQLAKFNVHFATGPATKRTAESFGPGHTCVEVGYPKTDFLFRETEIPSVVAEDCSFAEDLPLVVYAPHHHEAASLSRYGLAVVDELLKSDVNVVVKLHGLMLAADNPLRKYHALLEDMAKSNPRLRRARSSEPGDYYKLADVVVGDTGSNSTAFESILCKKPVVLLLAKNDEVLADAQSFEATMARLSTTVGRIQDLPKAVLDAISTPKDVIERNHAEAARFLYNPGHAADVAVREIGKALSNGSGETRDARKISFVIPAYNEEKYIGDCLKHIMELKNDPWMHEVIVVDNASTDATASIARSFPGVTVVEEKRKGIAAARLKGLEVATGDLYASIDADCRITPTWLSEVKKQFAGDPGLVGLVGEYHYFDMPGPTRFLRSVIALFTSLRLWLLRKEKQFSRGGNSVYVTQKLRQEHAFDPEITYFGEDIHTTMALRKVGTVRYDPRLIVESSARRVNGEGFWKMLFLEKINSAWEHTTGKPLFVHEARHWR